MEATTPRITAHDSDSDLEDVAHAIGELNLTSVLVDDNVAADFRENHAADNDIITEVLLAAEQADIWADDLAPLLKSCFVCLEEYPISHTLPMFCYEQHWVCYDCIPSMIQSAVNAEYSFPPKCCDFFLGLRIEDFEHVFAKSHPTLSAEYRAKEDEYQTFRAFRRVCANESCRTFLSTEAYQYKGERTFASCPKCETVTCIKCASKYIEEEEHECQTATMSIDIPYNDENRWKFCPYCQKAIVLVLGCNHITCHCGNDWCFQCLRPWQGFHNCETDGDLNYDEEGFGTDGYHQVTQLDRNGYNRDGVNVEGRTHDGIPIKGFAKRNGKGHRLNPFLRQIAFNDVRPEERREAAMLVMIEELENGVIHETDDIDDLLVRRFDMPNPNRHEDEDEDGDEDEGEYEGEYESEYEGEDEGEDEGAAFQTRHMS